MIQPNVAGTKERQRPCRCEAAQESVGTHRSVEISKLVQLSLLWDLWDLLRKESFSFMCKKTFHRISVSAAVEEDRILKYDLCFLNIMFFLTKQLNKLHLYRSDCRHFYNKLLYYQTFVLNI